MKMSFSPNKSRYSSLKRNQKSIAASKQSKLATDFGYKTQYAPGESSANIITRDHLVEDKDNRDEMGNKTTQEQHALNEDSFRNNDFALETADNNFVQNNTLSKHTTKEEFSKSFHNGSKKMS